MIHTIGHSNHPIGRFLELLGQHDISVIADVRSTPYSRFNPQFGKERLERSLAEHGIGYIFLGEELGARTRDPECYDEDGRVSYARLARTAPFRSGLRRLLAEIRERRVALMCAEREPLECHRTLLVARELEREGVPIAHILADGSIESHEHTLQRLANDLHLSTTDWFRSPADVREEAYNLQGARIAYVKKHP